MVKVEWKKGLIAGGQRPAEINQNSPRDVVPRLLSIARKNTNHPSFEGCYESSNLHLIEAMACLEC